MRSRLPMTFASILLAAPTPAAAASGPDWVPVPDVPPPAGARAAGLNDVAVLSATSVWAVGAWWDDRSHLLTAHWDGTGWTHVPAPDPPQPGNRYELTAVDAVGPDDVWAAGSLQSTLPGAPVATLVMHYNGKGWSVVPSPSPRSAGARAALIGIAMSTMDGWAVGTTRESGPTQGLILRWVQDRWIQVPLPPMTALASDLRAVHITSADDAWAAGSQVRGDGRRIPLVLHWDGDAWAVAPTPDDGADDSTLASVTAAGPADAWAVGRDCRQTTQGRICRPLVLHLSAGEWAAVPTDADRGTELTEVIQLSPVDVSVYGYDVTDLARETDHVEDWDPVENRFRASTSPPGPQSTNTGQPASALEAAAADQATGTVFAVGWLDDPFHGATHVVGRL